MNKEADDNIRWDLVEDKLDHNNSSFVNTTELTEEEQDVLLFFNKLRSEIKDNHTEDAFPIEAGWHAVIAKIDKATPEIPTIGKHVFMFNYKHAVAIMLLILANLAFWQMFFGIQNNSIDAEADPAMHGMASVLPWNDAKGDSIIMNSLPFPGIEQRPAAPEDLVFLTPKSIAENSAAFNTIVVPRGKRSLILLPDSSKVWVNSDSKIIYPVTFSGTSREVTLEGEAYFVVKKDQQQPFIVHTKNIDVKVLGTSFNMNTYSPIVYTTLETGSLLVSHKNNQVMVKPGEQVMLNDSSGLLMKQVVNVKSFTAWKNGDIYLENRSLEDIMNILERQFNCETEFTDPALKSFRFTVDLLAPIKLQQVLDYIHILDGSLRFDVNKKKIVISQY